MTSFLRGAPPPKKNLGSAPEQVQMILLALVFASNLVFTWVIPTSCAFACVASKNRLSGPFTRRREVDLYKRITQEHAHCLFFLHRVYKAASVIRVDRLPYLRARVTLAGRLTLSLIKHFRWFLSIALRIPNAHVFRVISARKWALASTQRNKFPSS